MLRLIDGMNMENEIIASALAACKLAPWARCLVEVGGHFSKWTDLDENGDILDHAINEFCAAGSGAFLEQQASRLGIALAALSSSAARAPSGAAIAGRCSVFAKSDMIHLQQKGTPLDEIAYGVCLALARNYAATVLRGKEPARPVALIGGAAANLGLLRALREVLCLNDVDLIVPKYYDVFGAVGAALSAAERSKTTFNSKSFAKRVSGAFSKKVFIQNGLEPLPADEEGGPEFEKDTVSIPIEGDVFLGVDLGSVSTNFVLIDKECSILAGVYLPTRGQPIAVLEEGIARLRKRGASRIKVLAAATTGSGRYLAARFLKADAAQNEITAQLRSTLHYFPDVNTIFEIGGQDSKYISVKDGSISDFAMNKVCAAGTGSFLEEQAAGLGVDIIQEFEEMALYSKSPVDLGSRCTVFMDTELVHALQRGARLEDVAAGLAYSVAQNYLDKVVANKPIGRNVIFQGGVASNRAVVSAFSRILGKDIRIHPYNRLSGAIGAALIARDMYDKDPFQTTFLGFEGKIDYKLSSFECPHCPNMCQVTRMEKGKDVVFFGDVCDRYSGTSANGMKAEGEQDLSKLREEILNGCVETIVLEKPVEHEPSLVIKLLERHSSKIITPRDPDPPRVSAATSKGTIGIPRASLYFELNALWAPMWKHMGYEVIDSGRSTKKLLDKGIHKLNTEACLPVKMAYSHVLKLVEKKPDYIFLPSILDLPDLFGSPESCSTCPYTQSLPYMVSGTVNARLLIPQINLSLERDGIPEGLEILVDELGMEKMNLKAAYQKGKKTFLDFKQALLNKGKEVMASGFQRAAVLIGKPYNIYDAFLNMNLVRHLNRMGMMAIPFEFISHGKNLNDTWDSLPWRFNRDYIKVAKSLREDERLYPVIVSNFGCGPDGFTIKHLERLLEGKPALFLEFDEHRGEAGLVTRLEAFIDEVDSHYEKKHAPHRFIGKSSKIVSKPMKGKFFIPNFADHAHAYAGVLRYVGIEAEVLPPPASDVQRRGEQFSSGKECHPYSLIAGDLVKLVESLPEGADPVVFFFPGSSIPCLLSQYGPGCRLILDQMDVDLVEVFTPNAKEFFDLIGLQGGIRLWRGLFAMDMLAKAYCELRPYELNKNTVDGIHRINCRELAKAVEGGDVIKTTEECIERLSSIEMDRSAWARRIRPVVGVAGDIYTRTNRNANQNLFNTLEEMGCEVWPSPFLVDVFDFGLKMDFARSLYRRDFMEFLHKAWIIGLKELSEQRIRKLFQERFRHAEEPGYREVKAIAAPYIGERSSEVLVLNIAKMVDFATKGADGIINAMCINCMVGSVSAAMTSQIRKDHGNIPIVNLVFGNRSETAHSLLLETFIYQVNKFAKRKDR